ncbi:MAG: hypothetical protein ABI145_01775 [Steroidobacteraceae bacterium]
MLLRKDTVALLPPSEISKVAQLVDLIVTSFVTPGSIPFGQITIVGHADKDFHGAAFEQEVSVHRAIAVQNALRDGIIRGLKQHGISHLVSGSIAFSTKGVGSRDPDPSNLPRTTQRILNRRVEVKLHRLGAPLPPRDTFESRIGRFLNLLKTRKVDPDPTGRRTSRSVCILGKMLRPDVLDLFVDGTAENEIIGSQRVTGNLCGFTGNYDPPVISATDLLKFLGTVRTVLDGPGFGPTVSDARILSGLSELIFIINEGIIRVERYITLNTSDFGYTGDKTRGLRLSSIFADHLNDPASIYSCYRDFHGNE